MNTQDIEEKPYAKYLQNDRGDWWSGQYGWYPGTLHRVPLTDIEVQIRINAEVALGADRQGFSWEDSDLTYNP